MKYLVSLYNKARATKKTVEDQDDINQYIALGELVSCIDDVRMDALVSPVFKLADLTSLNPTRLEQLGTDCVIKTAVDIVNPGQIPIITVDQPLYTLAKQIQWRWPKTHGEDHFIILFGGLHIEMAALKSLGDLLDASGWTGALVLAGVATTCTADSFLKAAHVTRTWRAHQITASSLYLLLQQAYNHYTSGLDEGKDPMSLDDWCAERFDASPQFQFCFIIL